MKGKTGKLSVFPEVFWENREIICFSRSFLGKQGNYLFFQEFSGKTGKLSVFSGVFWENKEIICFSMSFPGKQGNYLFFQEFSGKTGKLSVFSGVFQGQGRKFQIFRSFPGIPGAVITMVLERNKVNVLRKSLVGSQRQNILKVVQECTPSDKGFYCRITVLKNLKAKCNLHHT